MENSRLAIAALIFILLILGINFVMYGIVRGVTRGGKNDPLLNIMKAMNSTQPKKNDEMEELRRTVDELNKGKEKTNGESE